MAVTIPIQSKYANAIIFCIVDVLGLWSIHRCLKGLQAYYLYQLARSGRRVPIARSRIPVFSGELLKGFTPVGFLFVAINAASIVLAFIGTLGVNGETESSWKPISLTNTTTYVNTNSRWNQGSTFYPVAATCFSQNDTHYAFWPVAFNIDENRSSVDELGDIVWPLNPTCQKKAPGVTPLVMVECMRLNNEPCSIYDVSPNFRLTVNSTAVNSSKPMKLLTEYAISAIQTQLFEPNETNPYSTFSGRRGLAFVFRHPLTAEINKAIIFLNDEQNRRWIIAAGKMSPSDTSQLSFNLFRPAFLTPTELLSPNSVIFEVLREPSDFGLVEFSTKNLPLLIQHLFTGDLFKSAESTRQAFRKELLNVTVISIDSVILYTTLCVLLITLFFTKEILFFFILRYRDVSGYELFATDFDQMSRSLRKFMEKDNDIAYSGAHAELGIYTDNVGTVRVGPSIRSSDRVQQDARNPHSLFS